MKNKISSLLFGLFLILAGGYALAIQLGYIQNLAEQTWMVVFAAASILFWIIYFVSGIRNWGWLFPACIFAALAGTLYIVDSAIRDEWIATIILCSVAIPFVIGYLLDRSRWGLLIPAYVLGFVAFIPSLSTAIAGQWVGSFIVVMIGLPFLVVYLVAPKAWWAIFPAGSLLSVGVMIALTSLSLGFDAGTFAVGVMFLGLALTFWLVWLRRAKIPTSWAKYLALVMICLAFVLFMITAGFEFFWPLALIIAGLVMLLFSLRPKHTKDKEAFQKSKGDDSNS